MTYTKKVKRKSRPQCRYLYKLMVLKITVYFRSFAELLCTGSWLHAIESLNQSLWVISGYGMFKVMMTIICPIQNGQIKLCF